MAAIDRWTTWPPGALRGTPLYGPLATLLGRRVVITNASMYPLLAPGDRVLVDRLAYRGASPRRGDVVLVEATDLPADRMVKLVAGLPGERVAVARDQLWIDGRPVAYHRPMVGSLPGEWRLGRHEYFLLSYAVAIGTDSRHFGPVRRSALRGRAMRIEWPPGRRGPLGAVSLEPQARTEE